MSFPPILTWSSIQKAIEGKDEIKPRDKGGYIVFDYDYQGRDTFAGNPLLRECRGIKFSPSGLLLARPFHKFFNYGEHPETLQLDLSKPHQVMDKLDGTMIHPIFLGSELTFCTRAGVTDHALAALSHATANHMQFCRDALCLGFTPIFEYTGPQNCVVIRYSQPSLTLLAARKNTTGAYLGRHDLEYLANDYNVPIVSCWDHSIRSVSSLVEAIKKMDGKEGYVIKQGDLFVKIKTEDYVLKHKTKDGLSQERNIIALILQRKLDDVLQLLDKPDALLEYSEAVQEGLRRTERRLVSILERDANLDRKSFALAHKDDPAFSVLMRSYSNPATLRIELEGYITEHLTNNERCSRIKHLIGDPKCPFETI